MPLLGRQFKRFDFVTSGMYVRRKLLSSLTEPDFARAYDRVSALHRPHYGKWPDFRWRAHTAVWAAKTGLAHEGAFVELGVHTGFLSHMICKVLDFAALDRKFNLFDTFEGTPIERVSEIERGQASANNSNYFDVYETTKSHFSAFPNVELVRGVLPESLARGTIDCTCYLSIDLNYAAAEIASIDALWSRMSPGAVIVLDDHAWHGHHPQKEAWDIWAREKGTAVFTVPTGQGLIVK